MFKKRETVVQNIAYLALMAAINVIFVLLTAVLPPLMFILIFILPLASAVVTIFCKKRYFPIYFIVTTGLCLLATCGIYIYDTFFYVIPSMITGFVFGLMIEKKVNGIHVLTATTAIQYVLTLLTFIILSAIVPNINFFDVLLNMFGLSNFEFKEVFVHVFCFLLASIQMLFTYVIIKFEIRKLGFEINLNDNFRFTTNIISLALLILAISAYFYYAPLVYIFIFVALFYFIYQSIELILSKKIPNYIILGSIILLSVFIFAMLYSYPIKPLAIVLLCIPLGLVNLVHFINNYFTKTENSVE